MNGYLLEKGFKKFTNYDYLGYAGALKLPNKEEPMLRTVEFPDGYIDVIISGDGADSTMISLYSGDHAYIVSLPGYNMCHIAVAISLLDYFNDFESCKEALEAAISDYEFKSIL